jgi:GNAT superfamily N-acetyltransferase
MITVRPAEISDLYDLSVMWTDMVREELGKYYQPDYLFWENIVGKALETDKNFVMLIAEDDDSPVGFIMGNRYYEPADSKVHGISQHIYVKPEYRKTGVAPRLYRTFARAMWKMGVQIMSLCCVPGRQEFWARKGFKPSQMIFSKETSNA